MWEKRKGQDCPVQKKGGFRVVSVDYETKLSVVSVGLEVINTVFLNFCEAVLSLSRCPVQDHHI